MLTPRLTNCQDCHKIPDLLKSIDCKLAELGNNMYNNVIFMLGRDVPAYTITQLIAYKRILTFKYCNPNYAGSVCVNDIAGKVIRLTSGCVSRCNEPTVCEITTCCVTVVPNPSTTTTSTSSTSTTTSTSTSSTTTTTTSIFPDCRVEGCFELVSTFELSCVMYSNSSQDFIYDVSNNTTTAVTLNNNEYGDFFANAHTNVRLWKGNMFTEIVEWIPSAIENVLTRNRTIVFKDGALGVTQNNNGRWVYLAPVANNLLLTTVQRSLSTNDLVSLDITDDVIFDTDVTTIFAFDVYAKCLMYTLDNKIITVINSDGSSQGDVILKQYSYPDGALEVSQVLPELSATAQANLFQDGGKLYVSEEGGTPPAVDKVYEIDLNTYGLTLVWDNDLVIQPLHSSLQCNVNSLSTPQTTTTTTTSDTLPGCLQFNYTSNVIQQSTWRGPGGQPVPTVGQESLTVSKFVEFAGPTTNTTGYTNWNQVPDVPYSVVFNIGGVDYSMTYRLEDGGIGFEDVNHGYFHTNSGTLFTQKTFQFSKINQEGVDNSAILSVFDEAAGDSVLVTAAGDCSTPDPDIPVTGNSYFTFWSDVSGSMDDTISVTAQIASVTGVKSITSGTQTAGQTQIRLLSSTNANIRVTEQQGGVGDTASKAFLCIVDGMEAIHPSIPSGTFVEYGGLDPATNQPTFDLLDSGGNSVALTADITFASGPITFNLTDAQKSIDYANTSNLRNLLQDFYATGGTEASGNTDRATNGSDEFEARVYWCHSGEERQIQMLSNKGLGGTIDATGYFPDADSLVIMAFGDESGTGYNMDGNFSGHAWKIRDIQTNARIKEDIENLRDFVEDIETAAGNTNIYRAKFFHPKATGTYTFSTIKPLVSPTGLLNAGINGADVLTSFDAGQPGQPAEKPASAYGPSQNVQDFPSASPARFAWSADLDNSPTNPEQYWYDEIRNALIAFGYGV
jgi:hypothetical protein